VRRFAWIAGLWLVAVVHAQAQERLPLELTWQAPSECPSSGDVRAELERAARARPGFSLTPLVAQARVEHRGTSYATTLLTEHDGQHGERRLEAADCKTLVRTVTLVLALAFGAGVEVAQGAVARDETAAGPPAGEEPAPAEGTPQSATPPPPPSTPNAAAVEARPTEEDLADRNADAGASSDHAGRASALRLALFAGGGAQLGLMPSAAFSLSVGAELSAGAFSIGLRTTAWPGVTDGVAAKLSARFDGLAGALQGCGQLPLAALTLALCARAWAGALRGRSSGAAPDGSATAPWYALGSAVSLSWPNGQWLRVRIEAGLAASLDRPRFVIEGLRQVHRVQPLVPELGALLIVAP
jgi:hypothetical protein